jgi:nucleoid-associated protein YejK
VFGAKAQANTIEAVETDLASAEKSGEQNQQSYNKKIYQYWNDQLFISP